MSGRVIAVMFAALVFLFFAIIATLPIVQFYGGKAVRAYERYDCYWNAAAPRCVRY